MIYFFNRLKKKKISKLKNNPQKKVIILKIGILSPKKPNSGKRAIAKSYLFLKKKISIFIPGIGHNLRQHSNILIRGGGARDLPSNYFSAIRGILDLIKVLNKTKRKSIYGIKTDINIKKKIRKKFRQI